MSDLGKCKVYLVQFDEAGEPTYTEIGETKPMEVSKDELQEQPERSCTGATYSFSCKVSDEKSFECFCRQFVDEWTLQCRRELAIFGRSRLAQFGKTHTVRQYVKARPHWFRTRSFCVRSPYG